MDAYLDGELPKVRRSRVERHLAACAACREYVESSQRVQLALQKHAATHAHDPQLELLWPRVERAVAGAVRQRESSSWSAWLRSAWARRRQLAPLPAAAAAVAVLLLIFLPNIRHQQPIAEEVIIESVSGQNVTYVVSKFKETNTSIIWIIEPNG